MSVIKFYVPEWWENWTTETIIDNVLQQIENAKLLEHIISIQRYREHVELYVKKQHLEKYLDMKINVDGVFFYFVAKEENVLVINIYGLELDTDWTNVVHAMSKFGDPIHYYELKRNWNEKSIKNGVRCIWIKNINVVPPDIIKQGDRQITFKETVTLRNNANDVEEGRLKEKVSEGHKEGNLQEEVREADIFIQEEGDKKPEKASHALLKIAGNISQDTKTGETHLDVLELLDAPKCYPKKNKLPTPTSTSSSIAIINSSTSIPIGILKTDKSGKHQQQKDDNGLKGHV